MPALFLYLLLFLGIHIQTFAIGEAENFVVVKDLKSELMVYDESQQRYLPYINDKKITFPIIALALDLKANSGYSFKIIATHNASLFIEGKIVDFLEKDKKSKYSIDSLKNIYQKDSLYLTVYNPNGKFENFSFEIISIQPEKLKTKESSSQDYYIHPRHLGSFTDYFVLATVLILVFVTVLYRTNPKYFHDFYNFPKAMSMKIREETYLSVRYITGTYLSFLIIQSFIIGFILLNIFHYRENLQSQFDFISTTTLTSSMMGWMKVSGVVFVSFLLKFFLVKSISQLFNLKAFSTIHFFDFFRLSIIFYLLVLIAIVILIPGFSFVDFAWIPSLIKIIIIFYIFRMLVLFLKLYKYAPFRNLHLILYICSTELLPLLVGFKIFINS